MEKKFNSNNESENDQPFQYAKRITVNLIYTTTNEETEFVLEMPRDFNEFSIKIYRHKTLKDLEKKVIKKLIRTIHSYEKTLETRSYITAFEDLMQIGKINFYPYFEYDPRLFPLNKTLSIEEMAEKRITQKCLNDGQKNFLHNSNLICIDLIFSFLI